MTIFSSIDLSLPNTAHWPNPALTDYRKFAQQTLDDGVVDLGTSEVRWLDSIRPYGVNMWRYSLLEREHARAVLRRLYKLRMSAS